MNEHQHPKFFDLGPERMKLRVAQFVAIYTRADFQTHQRHRLWYQAVRMHVDHDGALAADGGIAAAGLRAGFMLGR